MILHYIFNQLVIVTKGSIHWLETNESIIRRGDLPHATNGVLPPSASVSRYDPFIISGDYTPADFHMLLNWRSIPGNEGLKEPAVTLANILYSIRPQTHIITTLRDPVER